MILARLDGLSEESLQKIQAILRKAKVKQDDFLAKINKKNPKFNYDLSFFLNNSFTNAANSETQKERSEADKLFD